MAFIGVFGADVGLGVVDSPGTTCVPVGSGIWACVGWLGLRIVDAMLNAERFRQVLSALRLSRLLHLRGLWGKCFSRSAISLSFCSS